MHIDVVVRHMDLTVPCGIDVSFFHPSIWWRVVGGLAVHISPHKRNIGKALFHPLLSNDVLLKVEKTCQFVRFERKKWTDCG